MALKTWQGGGGDWTNAAGWGGTLPGRSDDAIIENGAPTITTDVGTVASLAVGTTTPRFGRLFITGGTLRVSGVFSAVAPLDIDSMGPGGSTVTVGGALVNGNNFHLGDFQLTRATTVTAGQLHNSGNIFMRGSTLAGASLKVMSGPDDGAAGHLAGRYFLAGKTTLSFATGQVTTIDGQLALTGASAQVTSAAAPSPNSALRGLSLISTLGVQGDPALLSLDNAVRVATDGDLTNNGELNVDSNVDRTGGSDLRVGGTLHQNGRAFWGASRLATTTRVAAVTLDNTGQTFVFGGTSGGASGTTTVAVTDASTNSGTLSLGARATLATGSYRQTATGVTGFGFLLQGGPTPAASGRITASAGVALDGGTALVDPLQAGQSIVLASFKPGSLTGMFDHLALRGPTVTAGSGTVVRQADGTLVGVTYDNGAGTITLRTAAAVATTVDTWKGSNGAWTEASRWSAGVPAFYADVVIGPGGAQVALGTDATINSLALGAGDTLATAAGTDLSIGATASVGAGATLLVGGQITVDSAFRNDGLVRVAGTADIRGNISGSGQFSVGDGALLEFGGASGSRVDFAGRNATLTLDTPYLFTGTLANIGIGDSIDLVGVKVGNVRSVGGQSLTVDKTDGSSQTFKLDGVAGRSAFGVRDDGAGGSRITLLSYGPPRSGMPTFSGAVAQAGAAPADAAPSVFAMAEASASPGLVEHLGAFDRHGILV